MLSVECVYVCIMAMCYALDGVYSYIHVAVHVSHINNMRCELIYIYKYTYAYTFLILFGWKSIAIVCVLFVELPNILPNFETMQESIQRFSAEKLTMFYLHSTPS